MGPLIYWLSLVCRLPTLVSSSSKRGSLRAAVLLTLKPRAFCRSTRSLSSTGKFQLDLMDSAFGVSPQSTGMGQLRSQIAEQQEAVTAVLCVDHAASTYKV